MAEILQKIDHSESVGGTWINPNPTSPFNAQTIPGIVVSNDDTLVLGVLIHADYYSNPQYREIQLYSLYRGATYTIKTTVTSAERNFTVNNDGTISFARTNQGISDEAIRYLVPLKISLI